MYRTRNFLYEGEPKIIWNSVAVGEATKFLPLCALEANLSKFSALGVATFGCNKLFCKVFWLVLLFL